jgi:hypothetical protein
MSRIPSEFVDLDPDNRWVADILRQGEPDDGEDEEDDEEEDEEGEDDGSSDGYSE